VVPRDLVTFCGRWFDNFLTNTKVLRLRHHQPQFEPGAMSTTGPWSSWYDSRLGYERSRTGLLKPCHPGRRLRRNKKRERGDARGCAARLAGLNSWLLRNYCRVGGGRAFTTSHSQSLTKMCACALRCLEVRARTRTLPLCLCSTPPEAQM